MSRWMIGDIGVDRVQEIEGPMFRPQDVFPDYDPEVLERHGSDLILAIIRRNWAWCWGRFKAT